MDNTTLPPDLIAALGSEKQDFAVKARRAQPLIMSLFVMLFGVAWTIFTSIIVLVFFGPLSQDKEIQFELNGVTTVASLNNWEPLIVPAISIGIFVMIGIGIVLGGIYALFKKGGYFVGTPTRLVHYQNRKIRSMDWEQFSGNMEVRGNAQKGDITLEMRTGQRISRKRGTDQYVPDSIYIAGISDVMTIEQICRKRIKENDPTPPARN